MTGSMGGIQITLPGHPNILFLDTTFKNAQLIINDFSAHVPGDDYGLLSLNSRENRSISARNPRLKSHLANAHFEVYFWGQPFLIIRTPKKWKMTNMIVL